MGRILDSLTRLLLQEKLLRRLRGEVGEAEASVCEVHMKQGQEYRIRWVSLNGAGPVELSLRAAGGRAVPIVADKNGFAFVALEGGVYEVWAGLRAGEGGRKRIPVEITVCSVFAPPHYVEKNVSMY